jgi:GTP cyclohydrolase I
MEKLPGSGVQVVSPEVYSRQKLVEPMPFEKSFNNDLARTLARSRNPEQTIDEELTKLRKRALELNAARAQMSEGYAKVIEGLKIAFPQIDLTDKNLVGSPDRMARALLEVCSGLGTDEKEIFRSTFPAENYNEVIILKDIDYTSLCSHHFIPFKGQAHVGYLPDTSKGEESRVVGLSKLAHIVDMHAQRPQLQERMCYGIMESIKKELRPAGVMVVIEGAHGCLTCRSAKKANANMITSALDGKFREDSKLRAEFLSLIGKG